MVKKIFSAFFIILALVAVYSYYQKNNPSVKKIFNLPKGETSQLTGTAGQPSQSAQQPSESSKTIFLEVNQPINNATVTDTVISLIGKTIPNGSVYVDDQELKADTNGNFSTTVTLSEGQNDIYVIASDDLGNSAEKDIIVNLESTQ